MAVMLDPRRGRIAAGALFHSFATTGIHGHSQMPEDWVPKGMTRGSLENLLFITLTVSIDYQRDADALWASARRTYDDPETRYLFDPQALHEAGNDKVRQDMLKHGLSKKPNQDSHVWQTIGVTFYKKWQGDPRRFLSDCRWDGPTVLRRLKEDRHPLQNRLVTDYPFLRGDKIGPLWLRMLRDNVGISQLITLDQVPIPVDVHVARATLCLGVVRGIFKGNLSELFPTIRDAWFQSVQGLTAKGLPMIALDVDEPLWHLSRYGCTKRNKEEECCPLRHRCEMSSMCVSGLVRLEKGLVEIAT